jgi:DNA transformation protein
MHSSGQGRAIKLEDIPNIGKSIAADLRAVGIHHPYQLAERDPLAIFIELAGAMCRRHDPCVLYVLMSARHFLESGLAVPWWKFTEQGKELLASHWGPGRK